MKALSVIIPFLDSATTLQSYLPQILNRISKPALAEIILVDASESSDVKRICEDLHVQYIFCKEKGRAIQMNTGAAYARGKWLFFLHIDSIPPDSYDRLIISQDSAESGCFQLKFDWDHWFLEFFAWFTRFHWTVARGGDQGLFVRRDTFIDLKGFKKIPIMEDVDMCRRLMKRRSFTILQQKIVTSARKYRKQGVYRLQLIFTWITILYWFGADADHLKKFYDKKI